MILIIAICLLLCLLYKKYMDRFKKWSQLPSVKPHWFWGNRPIFKSTFKDIFLSHYNAMEGHRFGIFWHGSEPCIFLRDLHLIKKVQITDYDHFIDFGFQPASYQKRGINNFGLADMRGEEWRRTKRMVTSSFSAPRLKKTLPAMNDCAIKLVDYLHSQDDKEFVDGLEFSKKYFLSCIASVGFGLNIDCFGEQESSFEKNAKNILNVNRFLFNEFFPSIASFLKIGIIDHKFEKFLSTLCKDLVKQRRLRKMQYNDVLNNLIEVAAEHTEMTEEIMYKTCVQFFTDGYDSAAQTFGVLLYYLTINPDIQEKLQSDIDDLFETDAPGEEISQEDINNMKYLDQVICEGQRLGCFAFTARLCTRDWQVPGERFVIPKDTQVYIPIVGLHYDPKYFPEPERFDPDRFENKGNIDSSTFQTFGSGPRQCLGKNLYMIESKVLLIHLLRNFSLKPYGEMPDRLVWTNDSFIGTSRYNIRLVKRDNN